MEKILEADDIAKSQSALDELFQEVSLLEGHLSSGTSLGNAAQYLKSLQQSRVMLGNPETSLVRLTPRLFSEVGIEIDGVIKQQMKDRYNFFYLTIPASFWTQRGITYKRFECALKFGPKGDSEPIIQTLFPRNEWKEIFTVKGGLDLGLSASLNWGAAVDVSLPIESIPAQLRGQVSISNEGHIRVVSPKFEFRLSYDTITVMGQGNSNCQWIVNKPTSSETNDLNFGIVFKTPKSTRLIQLEGIFGAYPKLTLNPAIKDMFRHLKVKTQALINGEYIELVIGDSKKWEIDLPD